MKPTTEPDIRLVKVTPTLAKAMLERNLDGQRPLRDSKVKQYARDMAAGRWQFTGDTIKLSPAGDLMDGQHRLAALLEAKATLELLVAYGVAREAMTVIDTGAARTYADVLHMAGAPNRTVLASIVRRVVFWEAGHRIPSGALVPSHAELEDRYAKDVDGFDTATRRAGDIRNQGISQGMPAGTAYYVFAQVDAEQAAAFFDGLITGADLPPKSPILVLRHRLMRRSQERLTPHEQLALYVLAWNAYRKDKPTSYLPIPKDKDTGRLTSRVFPEPK